MPDIIDQGNMESLQTTSRYGFSGVKLDDLGASEYTLATVVSDVSGSVTTWIRDLESCLSVVAKSCQDSPRAENLLLRLVTFSDQVEEVHGFKLLEDIDPDDYKNSLSTRGMAALYDAVHSSVEATADYARLLVDQGDMSAVNAVIYVLTDGGDNASKATKKMIKDAIAQARRDERLESISIILVGVGYDDGYLKQYLDEFKNEADLDQFVDMTKLFQESSPEKALAKLAGYVSKSISSTSQALASGSSSISSSLLTF